jgi:hypothetical protein
VPKWAAKFREIGAQLAEATVAMGAAGRGSAGTLADGGNAGELGVSNELSREAQQSAAAAREPMLEVAVEAGALVFTYANVASVDVRWYRMDIELLFSTSPFMAVAGSSDGSGGAAGGKGATGGGAPRVGQFSFVRPNGSLRVALPPVAGPAGKQGEHRVPLPAEVARSNVMLEAVAAGVRRSLPFFANNMRVAVTEAYGRLKVTAADNGAPLPRAYVKVYWRGRDGSDSKPRFYKDGYTDARGVFDYTSLSTDELARVARFALLVVTDAHGAAVREAAPPTNM